MTNQDLNQLSETSANLGCLWSNLCFVQTHLNNTIIPGMHGDLETFHSSLKILRLETELLLKKLEDRINTALKSDIN